MLNIKYILVVGAFLAMSAFAGYETESVGTAVTIKKDGVAIKTVQRAANEDYLKSIESTVKAIKESEAGTKEAVALLRSVDEHDMVAETEANGRDAVKTLEEGLEVIIKLLK